MSLRDLAATWALANCPDPAVQRGLLQHLDRAIERGVGCSFTLGRGLTKAGKPFLVCCYCGELFAFQLTSRQAARRQLQPNMLVFAESLRQHSHGPISEPAICIADVAVDNTAALDRLQPITGTLHYRTKQPILEALAIRVDCEPPGRGSLTQYHYQSYLPVSDGTVRFSVSALGELRDPNGTPFVGPVPLFFQIWTAGQTMPPVIFPPSLPDAVGMPTAKPSQPLSPWAWQPSMPPAPMMVPATTSYPPAYDRVPRPSSPALPDRPISDIRAVLAEIM